MKIQTEVDDLGFFGDYGGTICARNTYASDN